MRLSCLQGNTPVLQVGDRVKGRHLATVRGPKVCKEWFKGVVIAVHSAGDAYDIQYDDGDDEEEVRGAQAPFASGLYTE